MLELERWWRSIVVRYVDKFHKFHRIGWKNDLQTRHFVGRDLERYVWRVENCKEKQKWAVEKPKLDNARKLCGIYCSGSDDEEFKDIMKNARRKLEVQMPAAMPCKTQREKYRKTCRVEKKCKTKTNLRGRAWKDLFTRITKIILQEKEWIHWVTTILFTNFFLCRKQWKYQMQKQQWIKDGNNSRKYRHGSCRKSEKKEVIAEARNEGKTVGVVDGHLSSQEFGVGAAVSDIQRSSCTPRRRCERWFRLLRSVYSARIIGVTNDGCKSNGCHVKTIRMRRTSSTRTNWRTKQLKNYTKSRRHPLMTTTLKTKNWDLLENYQKFALKLSEKCLYLGRIGRPGYFMVREHTCMCYHWVDQSLRQTLSTFDFIQSSHLSIQTIVSCGKHSSAMQIGTLFQDSDFAGDSEDSKSKSCGLLCIFGSHTFVPIRWMCKKQTSVSHSSTEAEIISLDAGLRMDGVPSSWSSGFGSRSVSFFPEPIQQHQRSNTRKFVA